MKVFSVRIVLVVMFLNGFFCRIVMAGNIQGSSPNLNGLAGKKSTPEPQKILTPKEAWNKELKDTESARDGIFTLGMVLVASGVLISLDGFKDNQKSNDDHHQYYQSSTKPDDGTNKIILGSVISSAGLASIIWGFQFNAKVQQLKQRGQENGFTFNLSPDKRGTVSVQYAVNFR